MSETASHTLSGVPETSLAALYWRAMESQRPDALIKDQKAEALVAQLDYDFDRIRQIPMPELLYEMRTMLTREMDRYARGFLGRHPEAVVVHIGCGLDSHFERVDNGQVEWYDLDLPDVVDLRRTRQRLRAVLTRYYPAALNLFGSLTAQVILRSLSQYPTPQAMSQLSYAQFSDFATEYGYQRCWCSPNNMLGCNNHIR